MFRFPCKYECLDKDVKSRNQDKSRRGEIAKANVFNKEEINY